MIKAARPGAQLRQRIIRNLANGWSLDLRLTPDLLNAIIDIGFYAGAEVQRRLSPAPCVEDSLVISSVEPAYTVQGSPAAIQYLRTTLRIHHELIERVALSEIRENVPENADRSPHGDRA